MSVGNVAAVEGNTAAGVGDSRLYFQNPDNSISQLAISSSLAKPHTTNSPGDVIVPSSEVLYGTPIAATTVNGTALQEVSNVFELIQLRLTMYYIRFTFTSFPQVMF